jgi:hypothetical protein
MLNEGNKIHNFIPYLRSSGSGTVINITVLVPTFYQVTVPLVKKLRFRFRIHNTAVNQCCGSA